VVGVLWGVSSKGDGDRGALFASELSIEFSGLSERWMRMMRMKHTRGNHKHTSRKVGVLGDAEVIGRGLTGGG